MPWPAWATERVDLVESDPSWPARGMALAAELNEVLGGKFTRSWLSVTYLPGVARPLLGGAGLGRASPS